MTDASARARPDSVPASIASGPTTSMLAYAFGERIAPPAGDFGAKLVPCSGREVDGDEFAVTIVQFALWDLFRRRRVGLEHAGWTGAVSTGAAGTAAVRTAGGTGDNAERNGASSPGSGIVVHPVPRAPLDDEVRHSLEHRLLRSAKSGREDRDLIDVVRQIYREDVADPFAEVFAMQNEAMLEQRFMRLDTAGRVAVPGPSDGRPPLIWICDAVAQHLVAFTRIAAEWKRWHDDDPDRFDAIHGAIRSAIESRTAPEPDDY